MLIHLKQLQDITNFIKENADDFKVVVLTVNDAIHFHAATTVDEYTDEIDYLKHYFGVTQKNCSDFNFLGSEFTFKMNYCYF